MVTNIDATINIVNSNIITPISIYHYVTLCNSHGFWFLLASNGLIIFNILCRKPCSSCSIAVNWRKRILILLDKFDRSFLISILTFPHRSNFLMQCNHVYSVLHWIRHNIAQSSFAALGPWSIFDSSHHVARQFFFSLW